MMEMMMSDMMVFENNNRIFMEDTMRNHGLFVEQSIQEHNAMFNNVTGNTVNEIDEAYFARMHKEITEFDIHVITPEPVKLELGISDFDRECKATQDKINKARLRIEAAIANF